MDYSPNPGSRLTYSKKVGFAELRNEINVFLKLHQLGNDKFAASLTGMITAAQRMSDRCNHKNGNKCIPSINVLNMVVKRLEIANHKCDGKKPQSCDEDTDLEDFEKEHHKDHDYDDFFKEWDKDDWHKHKKTCKRFVSDDALKIITEDIQWLIKSLGDETDKSDKKDHDHR